MNFAKYFSILTLVFGFSQQVSADDFIAQKSLIERQNLALQAAFSLKGLKVQNISLFDENSMWDNLAIGGLSGAREAFAFFGAAQSREGSFRLGMLAYSESEVVAVKCDVRVYFKSGTSHIEFMDSRYCREVMNPSIAALIGSGKMFGPPPAGLIVLERNCGVLKAGAQDEGLTGENCLITKASLGRNAEKASSFQFSEQNMDLYINNQGQPTLRQR